MTLTPTIQQLNFDLNLLYTIARTVLPKDILEGLMYGSDFDEPKQEDINEIKKLVDSNKYKMYISDVHDVYEFYRSDDDDFSCPVCGGKH